MMTFNPNSFAKSLKESYKAIPYPQGATAAKKMVADSIKSNGFNPEDVFTFIYSTMKASTKLSDSEWKKIVDAAVKRGDSFGKNLEVYKSSLKGKISYEEMFNLAATCCGLNPVLLSQELGLNLMNWTKIVETLIKTPVEVENEVVVEKSVPVKTKEKKVVKTKKVKMVSIKTSKVDPRSKSVTLVNEETGEVKTWTSFRACEKDLYGEKGGHGMVSQLFKPEKGLKRLKGGWTLPKEKKDSVTTRKYLRNRAVIQMKKDKRGHLRRVNTFNSITDASRATGISHSGISKTCSGTYQSTGGFVWKFAEAA